MFSRPLLGTQKNKISMSWTEYIFTHLIPTGIQSFRDNFRMWADLVWWENYKPYALLKDDDPFEECHSWFFSSINLDETYPKEFLEYLMKLADDVESGKVATVPFTKDMLEELDDLVGDMIDVDIGKELDDGDT